MKLIIGIILVISFLSCEKKVNKTSQGSGGVTTQVGDETDNTDNSGGGSSDTDDQGLAGEDTVGVIETPEIGCLEPGIGDQANDYYTFEGIVSHGEPKQGGKVFWSSSTDLSLFSNQSDQNVFMTDSRLNLRLVLKPAPEKNIKDSYNYTCEYPPVAYTKMKFTIGIKKDVNGGYIKQFTVSDIPVNGCSPVMETNLSSYTANEPYIVEIISASWDYSCTEATEMGHSQADQFCPYANVYSNYCFEVSLQVATDFTKNFK
jgi:hypothetical protein